MNDFLPPSSKCKYVLFHNHHLEIKPNQWLWRYMQQDMVNSCCMEGVCDMPLPLPFNSSRMLP